ncbi:hypothetical protein [Desulfovibrio sp. DV]|uniref:hypothetical protein n=1 Tax=Desulfovibrio sp. DV TaxID=1844708 RepID=UPI00094B8325|nr:hypothetical protein [Desulfovibrio sp. DV]
MDMCWRKDKASLQYFWFLISSILILGMTGCNATPKKAVAQFDSFQKVTSSITQDLPKIELLSLPQSQYHETDQLLRAIDSSGQRLLVLKENYGIDNLSPFQAHYAENFRVRVAFLQYLSMYSNSLKAIMSSSSISDLNTNIKSFGKAMDTANTSIISKMYPKLATISFSKIADGAAAIAIYGLEKARNAKVKYIISQATPTLQEVLRHMAIDIGSCSPPNAPSGAVALAVVNYYHTTLAQDQKKFDEIKAADKKKATERFNALQELIQKKHKFELTCLLLDETTAMLASYSQLHADLEKALDDDSGSLSTSLTNISLQIQTIESALNILGAKENKS